MLDISRITDHFELPPPADPDNDPMELAAVQCAMDIIGLFTFWNRPEFHGLERMPKEGPVLLVGNHGLMGADAPFVWRGVYEHTGRVVRGLGDNALFLAAPMTWALHKLGALHGTPENGLRFLKAGHLLNVYPGGARGALKRREMSYRLHWDRAKGFVRLALRAGSPVMLHMCCGNDDTFYNLGRIKFPARVMGHPKYEMPMLSGLGPFTRPVKLDYYFSEPIMLEGGPEGAEDSTLVDKHHAMLWRLGEEMLQEGLRRRKSVYLG